MGWEIASRRDRLLSTIEHAAPGFRLRRPVKRRPPKFDDEPVTNCEIGDLAATKIGNVLVTYVDGEAIVDQSGDVTIDTNDDPDEDAFFRLYALEVHGS